MNKFTIFSFEKYIGLFFQEWGNRLKDDVKTDRILSFLSVSLFSIVSMIAMVRLGVQIIVAAIILIVILISLFVGLFLAGFKLSGSVLNSIGNFFIKQSNTARFVCEVIPQVEKYQKAEYLIKIWNKEWFADAKNVTSMIGLGPGIGDFEDRVIFDKFESNKEQRFVPFYLNGVWIAPNEGVVDIFRKNSQIMRFIEADIPNNELIVTGTDNNKPRNQSLTPRKRIFFIAISGQIKEGNFHAQFEIEVTYKGKDEIVFPLVKNSFAIVNVTKEDKNKAPLWSIS